MTQSHSDSPYAALSPGYCVGCNIRILERSEERTCPRCGCVVDVVSDGMTETVLLSGDYAAGDEIATSRENELSDLIGRALHVYDCQSLLGRGGMAWVFLAKHRDLDRQCALKVLAPSLLERDPEYLQQFSVEGRTSAALVHPNVVTTHAIGTSDGLNYLEMEFVPGRSLQSRLQHETFSPARATAVMLQVAAGLAAAHRAGILHRDLKPDNILLTHDGIPKIADFGLAKRVCEGGGVLQHRIAGTPHFMAPELFQGASPTPASDVYSLGVCYYVLLTGVLPRSGRSFTDMFFGIENEPVPSVRQLRGDVPLEIAECIAMMLDANPQNRPASAVVAEQLLQAVSGHLRDIDLMIERVIDSEPMIDWVVRDGLRHEVGVQLPTGRRQRVIIEETGNCSHERLVNLFTLCSPADASHYEQALRLNSTVAHGAIAIRDVDGAPYFVMVETFPRATIDPEEIRKGILELAIHADAMEHSLTGDDVH